jgi:hypothetical protein
MNAGPAEIVAAVIDRRLGDLLTFAKQIRQALSVRCTAGH